MANIHHSNAKTTAIIRAEIQASEESVVKLGKKYHLNPKTILKWRHAGRVTDGKSGAKSPRSVLSSEEQGVICAFRRATKLSLDDCFVALSDKIPKLTRSNLHRCLVRHNLNVLPREDEAKPREKKPFKSYEQGFIHIDITEVRIETGKLYLFVAIDRATKYVYVELHTRMTNAVSCAFLTNLIKDLPFKITKILTDNGAQFTYNLLAEQLRPKTPHPFDAICTENAIEHRLTRFRHPWTNGQVEVTNRTIKQFTTKKYHYEAIDDLCQ